MATTILIDDAHPSISYAGGPWDQSGYPGEYMGTTTYTTHKGATARLTFAGTNVSVWGTIGDHEEVPISSYIIDGGNATIFNASRILQDVQYRRQFFQSKELTPANHTLVITTLADNAFYVLDYIEITPLVSNSTSSSSVPSSTSSPQAVSPPTTAPSGTTSPVASSKAGISLGPIVGGALGGLALLTIAFIAFLFFRRRRNHSSHHGEPTPTTNASLWTSFPRPNVDPPVPAHTTLDRHNEKRSLMPVSTPSSNTSGGNALRQGSHADSASVSSPSDVAPSSPRIIRPDLPPPRYEV